MIRVAPTAGHLLLNSDFIIIRMELKLSHFWELLPQIVNALKLILLSCQVNSNNVWTSLPQQYGIQAVCEILKAKFLRFPTNPAAFMLNSQVLGH